MRNLIRNHRNLIGLCLAVTAMAGVLLGAAAQRRAAPRPAAEPTYRSPYDLAYSPDGKWIAASDRTARALVLIDTASGKVAREVAIGGQAGAIAWSADSSKVYVADYDNGTIDEVGVADGKVLREIEVGPYPNAVALAPRKGLLLASSTGLNFISAIDLATGKEKARINVLREPFCIALSPDESMAVVSNLLPSGPASDPLVTAAVSLIDLDKMAVAANVNMPPNATCIRQVAVAPNGQYAYAVHTVGRTMLPATQLDRGWVNTNALTVIDLKNRKVEASVLMDNLAEGAADPWGIKLSKDGATAFVTIAGIHQLATVDIAGLHKALAGELPQPKNPYGGGKMELPPSIWQEIKADPAKKADLVNDLAALYIAGFITRTPLPGKGPRGLDVSPDGKTLAVGVYFSGNVLLVDPASAKVTSTIAVGNQPAATPIREGEVVFHDANHSFQHWVSCATCHPNHARADGLDWDLPNDGIGNPKNAKPLLYSHRTPPSMALGIREGMELATAAGFKFMMYQPQEQDLRNAKLYIQSLKHERSPYLLKNGELSDKAKRGKAIFESDKTNCTACHSGPLFTNLHSHNVGSQGPLDHKEHVIFDTPMLIELWRTAPYMHDGQAATLHEIFTKLNAQDMHGQTSHLTREQLDELVEYLLSL